MLKHQAAEIEHLQPRSKIDRLSWDDLRIFLTCGDTVSFREASRVMNVSPSTISRRIERLEQVLGVELFHRLPEGGTLTPSGELLLQSARAMHQSLCDLERNRATLNLTERGEVTIAVTEGLGSYWVMPKLVEFQQQNPKTAINFLCAMESVDVLRLEADIAIQFLKPERLDLISMRLGRLHVYPFAARTYLETYGTPSNYDDIQQHRLVEQVSPQLNSDALARYFRLESPEEVIGVRTNSSTAHLYAIEKGAGIGGLPTFASALGAPVVPVDIGDGYSLDIWLAYHPDTRKSPHKAVAINWIKSIFDSTIYPWFRDEFIHPSALLGKMPKQALANRGAGFMAVAPAVEKHRT